MVQERVDDSLGGIAKFLNENDVISLHNLQETVSKVKLHNEKGAGLNMQAHNFLHNLVPL